MKRNFTLRFHPAVHQDIQKAIDFYREQTLNEALSSRFLETLEAAFNKLISNALHYQVRYDDIRLLPLPTFPFCIHYRVNLAENLATVEGIFHDHQNPENWKSRTKTK